MRLFADDSKVYRIIYDENDEKQLQCDLNTLQEWSENLQLRFHPDKCEVLRITHARDHTSYPFKQEGCVTQALNRFNWPLLEHRRKVNRLTLMYKTPHGQAAINIPPYVKHTHCDEN